MRAAERMASADDTTRDKAMRRYSNAEAEFERLGGYAATSEGEAITSDLALPERVLDQPLRTLSGGQRRGRSWRQDAVTRGPDAAARAATNHLDADSITWLRAFLKAFDGSVVVISHDVELLAATVNRVMHLDATRSVLEIYNMGWDSCVKQREVDERRRRREKANAQNRPAPCATRPRGCATRPPRQSRPRSCCAVPTSCCQASRSGKPIEWPSCDCPSLRPAVGCR